MRVDANRPVTATGTAQPQGAAATAAASETQRVQASEQQMQAFRAMRAAQADMLKQLLTAIFGHIAQGLGGAAPKKGLSKSTNAPYGSHKLRANKDAKGGWSQLAKKANIGGAKDIARFNQAMDKLAGSRARVVEDGTTPKRALKFSADEVARIKAAPTEADAKKIVMQIISERTGVKLSDKGGKIDRSKKDGAEREALNKLLGTKVKAGHEKNATSALILDGLADSVTHAVRSTQTNQNGGELQAPPPAAPPGGTYGDDATSTPPPAQTAPPPASGEVTVDVGDYQDPAGKAGELASPLIFDLHGVGLKMKTGEKVFIDIDGDGKGEIITNLDDGVGLLVFDALDGAEFEGAGRDYFGDRTDLTAYGIHSKNDDGMWDNGFDALRALCEHFDMVRPDKQHLDAKDLAVLEKEIGLRMRIEGLMGKDRTFAELGITRINLGDPTKIQSIKSAQEDRFGNKLMKQEGATFIVKNVERDYADIWFNVIARDVEADARP